MKRQFRPLCRQAGDTIVEVLVAMAVLGVILAGAYTVANRSSNNERDAQEHTEALTLAESQVESLQSFTGSLSSGQCFYQASPSSLCYVPNTDLAGTPLSSDSNPPGVYSTYRYHITICEGSSCTPPLTDPTILTGNPPIKTYEVSVTWPALAGGTNSVQLYYRPQ